jgi:hypothetical protein
VTVPVSYSSVVTYPAVNYTTTTPTIACCGGDTTTVDDTIETVLDEDDTGVIQPPGEDLEPDLPDEAGGVGVTAPSDPPIPGSSVLAAEE